MLMSTEATGKRRFAFDAGLMERFWALENDVLANFHHSDANLSVRLNRLLLSAVLFGGLLNPAAWEGWLDAVSGRLRRLSNGQCLDEGATRSIHNKVTGQTWFADPLTQNLLARPLSVSSMTPARAAAEDGDYERLIRLPERALIAEVEAWILSAAKVKMMLLWPQLIVEHCAGALQSQSLNELSWRRLERPIVAVAPPSDTQLETIRVRSEPRQADLERNYYLADKGMSFICDAIIAAINASSAAVDPTLKAEQEAMKAELKACQIRHDKRAPSPVPDGTCGRNNLGWWMHEWLLAFCPKAPPTEGRKPKPKRARTLLDNVVALGLRVDWSDLWAVPLDDINAGTLEKLLHDVIRGKPKSLPMTQRLYAYLGFGKLAPPEGVQSTWTEAKIKSQMLSKPEYQAVLRRVVDWSGACGAHWLATMLMFRCGLRTREVVAMEIDHVTIVGDIVELLVDETPYVALKTDVSKRTLPLHALLTRDELAALLRFRARRIADCRDARAHARLLFATVYDPSDYKYLFDPIEDAIRTVRGLPAASDEERKTPAYIFSRCSVLRHSFVSYAVATMLLPKDEGGFALPAGITSDLVSLDRRDRLERALLCEGHLGLSSLEAVRQLAGHANFRRTLGTYTHLLDLVAGAYSWRLSSEPALPAEVVCALSSTPRQPSAAIRAAHRSAEVEKAPLQLSVDNLKRGEQAVLNIVMARERRPTGQRVAAWMPRGNAFLSRPQTKPVSATTVTDGALPEWRRDQVSDWRTLDRIVQMASRGVPVRLIADEVGVLETVVGKLTDRYHKLLSLRRRTTSRTQGTYRHRLLMDDPEAFTGVFDAEHGCWYEPLKPMPAQSRYRIDVMWERIKVRRNTPERLRPLYKWLRKHDDGKLLRKRKRRSSQSETAPTAVTGNASTSLAGMRVQQPVKTSAPSPAGVRKTAERWGPARVLLHLLLLGEAASPRALPAALVKAPVVTGRTDVLDKIAQDMREAKKRAKELKTRNDRLARSAQRKRVEDKAQADKARKGSKRGKIQREFTVESVSSREFDKRRATRPATENSTRSAASGILATEPYGRG